MLKEDIKHALDATSNKDKSPAELRAEYAEKIAQAVKDALRAWIQQAVAVPQDGGASLKATLLTAVDTL